jgi:hypothetical protein
MLNDFNPGPNWRNPNHTLKPAHELTPIAGLHIWKHCSDRHILQPLGLQSIQLTF